MNIKSYLKKSNDLVGLVRFVRRIIAKINYLSLITKSSIGADLIDERSNAFVGYYDHSPFNVDDESLVLIHKTRCPAWRKPSPKNKITIEIFNHIDKKVVKKLGESTAWNWQQGARALWLNAETVIFNIFDAVDNKYRARMVDINGLHIEDLPIPVQEIDSKERVYGLSYEALATIRPDYGYRNKAPTGNEDLINNTIVQYDTHTKNLKNLVKIKDLKKDVERRLGERIAKFKFNHISVNSNATKLIFLFRYFLNDRRITDLYVLCLETYNLKILAGNSNVSHFCWIGNDTVLVTMIGDDGFGYYKIAIEAGSIEQVWQYEDGHPNRLDGAHILTDTYPDKYALRRLLVRDIQSNEVKELASFPEPLLFQGETRCDLHPTISPSGHYIQIDCTVGHKRTIAILENPLFKKDI